MYKIEKSKYFSKKATKLVKNNNKLGIIIINVVEDLAENPRNPSLGSHKVNSPKFGECVSSRVTGDIRIIWRYKDENKLEIEVLELVDIGGHDQVY